jgi:hypothetical protein
MGVSADARSESTVIRLGVFRGREAETQLWMMRERNQSSYDSCSRQFPTELARLETTPTCVGRDVGPRPRERTVLGNGVDVFGVSAAAPDHCAVSQTVFLADPVLRLDLGRICATAGFGARSRSG